MTATEMWDMIGAGGTTATLLIVLILILREELVPGRTYRRACQREEKLQDQADEIVLLSQKLIAAINDRDGHR